MYAIERIRIIKQYLEEHGQVQVQALSSLLDVSEVTVRRDLERLEAEGWLTRTHGGAIINRPDPVAAPGENLFPEGEEDAYRGIAFVALQMISDGDVIMLSGGTANRVIASRLGERNGLTVLTNDIIIAAHISRQEGNKTVMLGGSLDRDDLSLYGAMALGNLDKFFVNLFFAEVDGLSRDLHFTVKSQEKAELITQARTVANKTIIVCPSDRSNFNAFFRLGNIHFAQNIISTSDLKDEYKGAIFNEGVPLFTSIDAYEGSR
ncbi:MAG: DeoR/GlpR transcriptional regulator [Spirochaetales bacterium]|nr:DeoR/GlpR transcriptional regulator [Spirochaetales bacterium]